MLKVVPSLRSSLMIALPTLPRGCHSLLVGTMMVFNGGLPYSKDCDVFELHLVGRSGTLAPNNK